MACSGRGSSGVTYTAPTRVPTATPLPPLPTLVPLGSEENPLRMLFVVDDVSAGEAGAEAIAESLSTAAGMTIEVALTTEAADAYHALCDGSVEVVSLPAFGHLAAVEAGCGEAVFQLERDGAAAEQSQLVAAGDQVFSISNFPDRIFCRTSLDSVTGWTVPLMVMQSNEIDPYIDLDGIIDAGTDDDVLQKIAAGECEIGATLVGAEVGLDNPDSIDVIEILPPVPHDSILLSLRLSGNVRALLTDLLRQEQAEMASLLSYDTFRPADSTDLSQLTALLDAVGVDILALSE